MNTLDRLRTDGWMVAVHNDYRVNGRSRTFWLFTHPSGIWAKGEGDSDQEALNYAAASAELHLKQSQDTARLTERCDAYKEALAAERRKAIEEAAALAEGLWRFYVDDAGEQQTVNVAEAILALATLKDKTP